MDDRSSQRKPKANRQGLQRFCVTQISNYNLGLAYYEKEMQGRDGERCYRLSKFGFVHQFYSGMYNKLSQSYFALLHDCMKYPEPDALQKDPAKWAEFRHLLLA